MDNTDLVRSIHRRTIYFGLISITGGRHDEKERGCRDLGGEILVGPKGMGGHGRYCVIKDPAGAISALFEPT